MQLWLCVSTILESKRFKKALVGKKQTNNNYELSELSCSLTIDLYPANHDYKLIISITNKKKIHKRRVK